MHLVTIGGSDAGISAALRAREVDPSWDVTVLVADEYPNYSICGLPYYLSGDVPDWHDLAHRTALRARQGGQRGRPRDVSPRDAAERVSRLLVDRCAATAEEYGDPATTSSGPTSQAPRAADAMLALGVI